MSAIAISRTSAADIEAAVIEDPSASLRAKEVLNEALQHLALSGFALTWQNEHPFKGTNLLSYSAGVRDEVTENALTIEVEVRVRADNGRSPPEDEWSLQLKAFGAGYSYANGSRAQDVLASVAVAEGSHAPGAASTTMRRMAILERLGVPMTKRAPPSVTPVVPEFARKLAERLIEAVQP